MNFVCWPGYIGGDAQEFPSAAWRLRWNAQRTLNRVLASLAGVPCDAQTCATAKAQLALWAETVLAAGVGAPADCLWLFDVTVESHYWSYYLRVTPTNMFTLLFLLEPLRPTFAHAHRDARWVLLPHLPVSVGVQFVPDPPAWSLFLEDSI